MGEKLKARLAALERGRAPELQAGGVVTYGPHETPEEAMQRAQRRGVTGPVLLVPAVMGEAEWETMMKEAGRAEH